MRRRVMKADWTAVFQVICAEHQSTPGASRCTRDSKRTPMVSWAPPGGRWRPVPRGPAALRVSELCSSCSLTRTGSPSGPTWSGRTRRPAARPPPPCARPPPPPARSRPPGRTCAPAAARRSWTGICSRWEAAASAPLYANEQAAPKKKQKWWKERKHRNKRQNQTKEKLGSKNKQARANVDLVLFFFLSLSFCCCFITSTALLTCFYLFYSFQWKESIFRVNVFFLI